MSGSELVKASRISKVYPDGTVALKDVDFDVRVGEIHGLLGENGAGKTTLTKILSGILHASSGEIQVMGQRANLKRPRDALELGIGMVHQHFALVTRFTAFENVVLGTNENPRGSSSGRLKEEITALSESVGFRLPLDERVENLSLGAQQRVEIVKMLYRKVRLLILDEPTSSLTPNETEELFKTLKTLRDEGKGVIFITHKLKEVMEICDRITVLRQGVVTGRTTPQESDRRTLAKMMVGREVVLELTKPQFSPGEPILTLDSISALNNSGAPAVKEVSLEVRRGEILGVAGVEGNGQTELAEAICGVRSIQGGRILLHGSDVSKASPREIRRAGAAFIPEDRRQSGLVTEMNLEENVILGKHREKQFASSGFAISWERVGEFARALIAKFGIIVPGPKSSVRSLSGGNQQKVVVSREMSGEPDFILASQPTRGLDVASTEYMRKLLIEARNKGKAVLLISADLDEILQLSDKVAVMYEGKLIGVLAGKEATKDRVGLLMGGIKE